MKTATVALCLIAIAALQAACVPSSSVPISGEIRFEFVRKAKADIHFKLTNQTSAQISFWGTRDWWWESVFPMGPVFECDTDRIHGRFLFIDGPHWEKFAIESGEEVDIVVDSYFLNGSDGNLSEGRCRLVLRLEGGTVVKSDEFASTTNTRSSATAVGFAEPNKLLQATCENARA